jgi:hypothetical protein
MFQKKWDIVFGGNFQDNLEEEGVSPQIPTAVEEGNHHEEERQDV